jgi:hypothetical protein
VNFPMQHLDSARKPHEQGITPKHDEKGSTVGQPTPSAPLLLSHTQEPRGEYAAEHGGNWPITAEWALVLVTIPLAFFTYRLWAATKNLVTDAQKTSADQAAAMESQRAVMAAQQAAMEAQVVAMKRQEDVALGTLNHLERQFAADHRPWIAVTVTAGTGLMYLPDKGYYITLECPVANSGRTPALRVQPEGRIFFYPNSGDDPAAEQRTLSDAVRLRRANGEGAGSAVFPNQPGRVRFTVTMTAGDQSAWDAWLHNRPAKADPEAKLMLIGCVAYGSAVGEQEHQTGFIFELHKGLHALDQGRYVITPDERDLLTNQLHIDPSRFGSGVTN